MYPWKVSAHEATSANTPEAHGPFPAHRGSNSSSLLGPVVASWNGGSRAATAGPVHRDRRPGQRGSPMAVPGAAARRLLALAPARSRRAFWSASWAGADPAAPSASSTSPDSNSSRKKKAPSGSGHHRLAAVMDAVNERKLPPELRGRGNAVRSVSRSQIPPHRSQEKSWLYLYLLVVLCSGQLIESRFDMMYAARIVVHS